MKAKELAKILLQNPELEVVFSNNVYANTYLEIEFVNIRKLDSTGDFNQLEMTENSNAEQFWCLE